MWINCHCQLATELSTNDKNINNSHGTSYPDKQMLIRGHSSITERPPPKFGGIATAYCIRCRFWRVIGGYIFSPVRGLIQDMAGHKTDVYPKKNVLSINIWPELRYTYLPMVLIPLTPRFKQASLSFSIGVDIVHKTGTNYAQGNTAIRPYDKDALTHTHTHRFSYSKRLHVRLRRPITNQQLQYARNQLVSYWHCNVSASAWAWTWAWADGMTNYHNGPHLTTAEPQPQRLLQNYSTEKNFATGLFEIRNKI